MTVTFLHTMFRDTFDKLSDLIREHDSCRPLPEQLVTFTVDAQIEERRPSNRPQVPLFSGELVLKTDRVQIDPSKYFLFIYFSEKK